MLTKERLEQFLREKATQLITTFPVTRVVKQGEPPQSVEDTVVLQKYQIGALTYMVSVFSVMNGWFVQTKQHSPLMVYCPFRKEVFIPPSGRDSQSVERALVDAVSEWFADENAISVSANGRRNDAMTKRFINLLQQNFTDDEVLDGRKRALASLGSNRTWETRPDSRFMYDIACDAVPDLLFAARSERGTLGSPKVDAYDAFYAAQTEDAYLDELFKETLQRQKINPLDKNSLLTFHATGNYCHYVTTKRALEKSVVYRKFLDIRKQLLAVAADAKTVNVVIEFNGKEFTIEKVSPVDAFLAPNHRTTISAHTVTGISSVDGKVKKVLTDTVQDIFLEPQDLTAKTRCKNSNELADELFANFEPMVNGKPNPFVLLHDTKPSKRDTTFGWLVCSPIPVSLIKRITYKGKTLYTEP